MDAGMIGSALEYTLSRTRLPICRAAATNVSMRSTSWGGAGTWTGRTLIARHRAKNRGQSDRLTASPNTLLSPSRWVMRAFWATSVKASRRSSA